jgi:hypothetical protein
MRPQLSAALAGWIMQPSYAPSEGMETAAPCGSGPGCPIVQKTTSKNKNMNETINHQSKNNTTSSGSGARKTHKDTDNFLVTVGGDHKQPN